MTLTDGVDCFPPESNQALCKFLAQRGVEVVGIGLCLNWQEKRDVKVSFDGRVIMVDNVQQLASAGLSELVKTLGRAAPRAVA
jgi:glycine/D-amino acid oxidase-like deaminating enzyme